MAASSEQILVSVIGGYLGAGKTTLLNHILRSGDHRIAVIVNDFGDINIDADLIASRDGQTVSLLNGCICCSLIDGFGSAMATVAAFEPRPERLVIETSGVADPAAVAAYAHGPGFALDSTIVVVDCETVRQRSSDAYVGDTVISQMGCADILVLNKVDLVEPPTLEAVRRWVRAMAPKARIVDAQNGSVDPATLFRTGSFRSGQASGTAPSPTPQTHTGPQTADRHESWAWSTDRPVSREDIERLMAWLPPQVIRAKGTLLLSDAPGQVSVLQRVGQRWTLRPADPWTASNGSSNLVFIAIRGTMDDDWLRWCPLS